jgi:sodium/potassium/calcium exchanger 6
LAGVTLLALGNGAPDVFAAYSAGSGGDGGDITFTVSCLMGSAFFITSVVMYLSVNGAEVVGDTKKIRVTKRFFLRDLLFFMIATLYLLVVMLFIGHITLYVTIGFIVLYGIFVVTVVV